MKPAEGYYTILDNVTRKMTVCQVIGEEVSFIGVSNGWNPNEVFDNDRVTVLSGPWEPPQTAVPSIPEERVLRLIEASEAFPNYTKLIPQGPAYRDVALLLRELLERRKA